MGRPWHLWVVGIVSLLWNAGGAYDYFMTQTANAAYLAQMPASAMAYLENMPLWSEAAWAFGVWGAVLGSLLLLFRSHYAFHAFVVSFIGMIGNLIYGLTGAGSPMTEMMGPLAMAFAAAIVIIGIALIIYSRRMSRVGQLY